MSEHEQASMNGNSYGRPVPGASGSLHRAAGRQPAGRDAGAQAQPRRLALRADASGGAAGARATAQRGARGLPARLRGGFGRPPRAREAATRAAPPRLPAGRRGAAVAREGPHADHVAAVHEIEEPRAPGMRLVHFGRTGVARIAPDSGEAHLP